MAEIGDRVRDRRVALSLSQEDLARECDLSVVTVSRLERGVIKDPNASTLDRIASVLKTTSADLIHGTSTAEVA